MLKEYSSKKDELEGIEALWARMLIAFLPKLSEDNTFVRPNGILVGCNDREEEEIYWREQREAVQSKLQAASKAEEQVATKVTGPIVEILDENESVDAWVDLDGAKVHKMTLVKNAFATEKMSTDRLKRVRGYSKFGVSPTDDMQLDESDASKLFFGSDPFITIAKMPAVIEGKKTTVCGLVVAVVQEFVVNNRQRFSVPIDDLDKFEIVGRVLQIQKNKKYNKWWWAVGETPAAETFTVQGVTSFGRINISFGANLEYV